MTSVKGSKYKAIVNVMGSIILKVPSHRQKTKAKFSFNVVAIAIVWCEWSLRVTSFAALKNSLPLDIFTTPHLCCLVRVTLVLEKTPKILEVAGTYKLNLDIL